MGKIKNKLKQFKFMIASKVNKVKNSEKSSFSSLPTVDIMKFKI